MDTAVVMRLALLLCLLLVACEPARVPISGPQPTPTATATPAPSQALRYGLGISLQPLNPDTQSIRQIALVDQLTTDDADGYDIVVGLSAQEDWAATAQGITLGWLIDTQQPPLNDPDVARIITSLLEAMPLANIAYADGPGIPATTVQDARAALLLLGLPDGIQLVIAHDVTLGVQQMVRQFALANIEITLLPVSKSQRSVIATNGQAHLYWTAWGSSDERTLLEGIIDGATVIELGALPLYYRLAEGIQITGYSAEGLPLIARQ